MARIELKNKFLLAPLAGFTDSAFRTISYEEGVDIAYTEMISAKAMHFKDEKTFRLIDIKDNEKFTGVQLFGSDPKILEEAVKTLDKDKRVKLIDLNIGCPAPKIFNNGDGSALLDNPKLIYEILSKMRSATEKPLSAKMRLGINDKKNYINIAKAIEESGVDFMTVHGRTRNEFYQGLADWEAIAEINQNVKIPVVGNGDINLDSDINKIKKDYNIESFMIGRGAVGSPWVFKKLKKELNNEEFFMLTIDEKFGIIKSHVEYICDNKKEKIAITQMRKQLQAYLKGMHKASDIKNKINTLETKDELLKVLDEYRKYLNEVGME